MAYLTLAQYRALTIAPPIYVDQVEADHAGWLDAQLAFWSMWLDSRLKKRYAAPFAAMPDTPPVVIGWLTRILDAELYYKRGISAKDEQWPEILQRAKDAKAEVKEAADSEKGLFELPLNATAPGETSVSRGGPLGYTEQSPYSWSVVQRDAARDEQQEIG